MKQTVNIRKQKSMIYKVVISAMLCAIGLIIPIMSPIKFVLEPASYTLASHVPIFIAMFLSPSCGIAVALVTSVGFLIGPFTPIIALRAATHVIFVTVGALLIKKFPNILHSIVKTSLFALGLSIIHAVGEMVVVAAFLAPDQTDIIRLVFGLVGVGTVIHSMVDFYISLIIWKTLGKHLGGNSI